jgi:predicted cupin superfamily sugar epimerase
MLTAEDIIRRLQLQPLPIEGGFYRETYRSPETLAGLLSRDASAGERVSGTAIYYLLHGGQVSALHRLVRDEVYHFYLGDPVELLLLYPDGTDAMHILGHDLEAGQRPQLLVPSGVWQGLRLAPASSAGRDACALLGTTMAPGFDPGEFELGNRDLLLARYPRRVQEILALTPQGDEEPS